MTIAAHRWLAPVLLTTTLAHAQEPAPAAPTRPLLEIELDGPAQLRTAMLPTNLGSRLASQEARELWAPLQRMVATLLAEACIEGEAATDLERQVLAYGGRLRLTLDVDDALAEKKTGRVFDLPLFGALRLRPDGHTDLAALGRAVAAIMQSKIEAPPTEVTAGEHRLRALRVAPGLDASLPQMIDGELVVFLGTDVGRAVSRTKRTPPEATLAGNVLAIRVDLAGAVALAARHELAGKSDRQNRVAERVFGTRALRDAHLLVSAAGPHVMVEMNMGFGEGARGMFDALFPDRPGLPKLVGLLPDGIGSWKVGRFDLQSFVATVIDVIGLEMGNRKEIEQSMRDELGFDLQADMIAHTGDSYLLLGSSWMSGDETDDELDGACLALALNDATAFAPRWKKLRDMFTGFVADTVESSEHRDVAITTWRFDKRPYMSFAVSRGLLLLAWGEDGLARLQAIIEREAEAKPDATPKPPADVARLLRSAPPGFNGCAVTTAKGPFSKQVTQLLEDAGRELPSWLPLDALLMETRARLRPLLDQPGLERIVTLTGYDDGRWRLRLLW